MEPKTIETREQMRTDEIWIVSYRINVCMFADCLYSFTFDMTVECGGVRGQPFFESICGWSGRLQWRFMCALLCSIWNNLDSTVFNQQRKMKRKKTENRERKTGNWNENWKRKTVHRYICVVVLRQTTDDSRSRSRSRVGHEMNDDLYVHIVFGLLSACLRKRGERERKSENNETVAMKARRRWTRRSGGVLGEAAFCLCNAFIDRFCSARVVRKIN